jgi:hypothetical protein
MIVEESIPSMISDFWEISRSAVKTATANDKKIVHNKTRSIRYNIEYDTFE